MVLTAQTESALIGSLLLKPDLFPEVCSMISPTDFLTDKAKRAFTAAASIYQKGETVSALSISKVDIELASYLAQSTSEHASPSFAIRYAKEIASESKTRRIDCGLKEILESKSDITQRLNSILDLYQREIFVDSKKPDIKSALYRFQKEQIENRKRGSLGISTGFKEFDVAYLQYVPGHTWVMGGYTSTGKTAMMVQKICNLLTSNSCPRIIVISTEMSERQVVSRILGNLTRVHPYRIMSCQYRQGEESKVREATKLIEPKPLIIHDDIYKVSDIETVFRKADLQGGVDIGFIDYVQNVQVPEASGDYQAGSILAKRLQKLAKDVNCTLVCLSQVSNNVGRGETEQLEFKGAGEWAAVADIGILLQRSRKKEYLLKYSVKKNRHGQLFNQNFEYKSDFTRLETVSA